MSTIHADLEAFHEFALAKLNNGGASSLPELMSLWLAARERDEVNAAIREGLRAIDEGKYRPAREFLEEVRQRLDQP